MEVYRFLFVAFYLWEQKDDRKLMKIKRLFLSIFPFTLAPIIFAIWRLFFFTSLRTSTDVDYLFTNFTNSFVLSLFEIFKRWFVDIYEMTIGAYVIPNSILVPKLGLREFCIAILLGLISILGFLFFTKIIYALNKEYEFAQHTTNQNRYLSFSMLSLLAAAISILPINISERDLSYLFFNRFSLPSVLGVSIFIIGMIYKFQSKKIQVTAISLLFFSSLITQYANNMRFSFERSETKNIWKNFYWRIPDLENGTALTGLRSSPIYEGYFIWSPTNLIYCPNNENLIFSAEVLNRDIEKNIEMKLPYEKEIRSFDLA